MQIFAHRLITVTKENTEKSQKSRHKAHESTPKEDQFRFSFVMCVGLCGSTFATGQDLNSSVSLQLKTTRITLAPCAAFLVLRSFLCFWFRMPRPRPSPTSSASGSGLP